MGGIFKTITKIAKIAAPVALTAFTGGAAAPLTVGSIAASVGKSLAINALTGAISGGSDKPKSSAVTGQTATSTSSQTAAPAETADEVEKKKRLALNAAGASGNTTSPLGVTTSANVTRRNLLGL